MIVVEGPDGAGKTTLIRRLLEDMDLHTTSRACTSEGGPVDNLGHWVNKKFESNVPRGAIIDRHPLISEPIYGPLIRGGYPDNYFEKPQWMTESMEKLYEGNLIIYCLPPLKIVLDNIEKSHEGTTDHLKGVTSSARAIWSQYEARMAVDLAWERSYRRDGLHHILVWDYTIRGSYRDLITHIGHYLDKV